MTASTGSDDEWADLARELNDEKSQPASDESAWEDTPGTAEDATTDADAESSEFGDGIESDGTEADGTEADGGDEGDAGTGDGQPGTGRKRRRRRRRRRKNGVGQPADATANGDDDAGDAPAAESDDADAEVEQNEPDDAAVEVEAVGDDDDYEETGDDAESAEDAGGELLRELIANWNVPSWDEIITGLSRPDR